MSGLRAVVVVPARDEAQRVGRCLRALAAQRDIRRNAFAVVLVLDRCTDATAAAAAATAAATGLALTVVESPAAGVGAARRHGMDLASTWLAGRPDGLIACTDADTEVDERWLAVQLALVAAGADAVGGRIDLDPAEAAGLPAAALARREARARARLRTVLAEDSAADHPFFSGASMSVTVRAYEAVSGLDPVEALEDEAFARRLVQARRRIVRSDAVRVRTSARTEGRAPRGLARDLALGHWLDHRRFDGRAYDAGRVRAAKGTTRVTLLCLGPAGAGAGAGERALRAAGVVDEVVALDPALGRGDALLAGLQTSTGDVVLVLDAASPTVALALLGPLLEDDGIVLVRGASGGGSTASDLTARPLLNLLVPDLAGFADPAALATAARRSLLEALPLPAGDGLEVALLVEALRTAGLDALAEARLLDGALAPPPACAATAFAVLCAVHGRMSEGHGPLSAGLVEPAADGAVRDVAVAERPALRDTTVRPA